MQNNQTPPNYEPPFEALQEVFEWFMHRYSTGGIDRVRQLFWERCALELAEKGLAAPDAAMYADELVQQWAQRFDPTMKG